MNAQSWKTPIIEGYGSITAFGDVAVKPDPNKEYKVLFHITSNNETEGVNASLWKMARLINLLGDGGVSQKKIQIAAVISGLATPISLTDEHYIERLQKSNPNLDLMKKLTEYGAVIHLCGQAAAAKGIDPKTDLNAYTKLTLSALIDIPTYQMDGYVAMF